MKLLILAKYPPRGPSSRYRFYQFFSHLADADIEWDVAPFFDDIYMEALFSNGSVSKLYLAKRYLGRLFACLKGRRYDAVWIEGELFPFLPGWFEQPLHAFLPHRRIYEFDDANWLRYEGKGFLWGKFAKILKGAAVIAGNRELADYVRRFTDDVTLIPTVVDWPKYADAKPQGDGRTLGWIGSNSTVHYLRDLLPTLRELHHQHPFRLKVIGADLQDDTLDIVQEPWSEAGEVALIESCDVGLMPLDDTPWSRGKCGLKLVQYLATGIPAVAGPVGVNRTYLQDSGGGFAASTPQEWREALTRLLNDAELRREMGDSGRSWAKTYMTTDAQAETLIAQITKG